MQWGIKLYDPGKTTMSLRRIVAVSNDAEIQQMARRVTRELFVADDLNEAYDIIDTVHPDMIILDHCLDPDHVYDLLNKTDKNLADVPVLVVGGVEGNACPYAKLTERRVFEYLQDRKDHAGLDEIVGRITERAKKTSGQTSMSDFFAEDYAATVTIVGRSRAIINTLKIIRLVAASQCNPILIIGETGTGKELAAEAIHNLRHPNESIVAINCAALTANLLESELFGHVKGSFTGADREKTGLLELAGQGTLFLDEISEMPKDLQAKLLRVLQEKTFRKVGGIKNIACNATIIASSNRNLNREVQANRFRRDLYYRLSTYPITIAPLRAHERRDDIRLLAEYFLKTSTICPEKVNKIASLTKMAIQALERHSWPGNVRELRNVIDRAILLETTDKIGLSSILIEPNENEWNGPSESQAFGHVKIKDFSLAKAERELICRALQETGWQKTRAADLLGISRATLYAKVEQYNIEKNTNPTKRTQDEWLEHATLQPAAPS